MADPIRTQILDAISTALAGITVANGYRTTITTVKKLAKDWASNDVNLGTVPWAGIVPGDETVRYLPFAHQEIEWPITVIVCFQVATRTDDGLVDECEAVRTDVRRKLHADPTLGVEGVHWIHLEGTLTAEAHPPAMEQGQAWVAIPCTVKFTEACSAS